jgi:hypothetical protein
MQARTFFSSDFLLRTLPLAAAIAAFAVAPAMAQEEEPNELQKVFGAMGILDLPKPDIDYSERSPLVVPQTAELPKPGQTDIKQLNPEWPVDQDITRAKKAAKDAKKPIDAVTDSFYGGRLVKQGDFKPAAKGSGSGSGEMTAGEEAMLGKNQYNPTQLGFKGWGKKEETVFTGEPDRQSLLQPPPGYRTPSPNAPYGVVEEEQNNKVMYKDRNDDRNTRQ